jgi:hypothetical protein
MQEPETGAITLERFKVLKNIGKGAFGSVRNSM